MGRWGPSARAQGQGCWEHPRELLSQLEMQHRDPPGLGHAQMKDTGEANQKSAVFFFFSPRLFQEASLLLGTTSFWILLSDFG